MKSVKPYLITVGVGWLLLGIAAAVYVHIKSVPTDIALPVALAFLLEYPFYLLPGFPDVRERFISQGKPRAALIFALSSVLPWLVFAVATGAFNFPALTVMLCIAILMNFWYIAFPIHTAVDLLYLAIFGAILILKVFTKLYPAPMPKLDVSVLGHIMLIRVMAFSFVAIRGATGWDYRFWPKKREWIAGFQWFVILLPATGAVYWALGLWAPRLVGGQPHPMNIGLTIATFFGVLWVISLSEEFVFRGLLQPWIEKWTSSPVIAIAVTAVLFGSVHLPFHFHGTFPNWRFAGVATILGVFCGLARKKTGTIQAGMVAHALTVALWKMFLQ